MEGFLNLNDVIFNYYFLYGGLFLSYLVYKIFHSLLCGENHKKTTFQSRGHTWRSIDCNKSIPYNIYCTVCEKLMLPLVGLFCESCALSACKKCYRSLDKKIRCRPISWPADKPFYHHWINVGTIPSSTDTSEEEIRKFFCSWCQRTKSSPESLINTNLELCDFYKYRHLIIPPSCVQIDKGSLVNIKPLQDAEWEPLIVFANRKSGSCKGDEVLSLFRGLLNPIQVIDLSSMAPENVVQWLPPRCRVLAAGGDGTIAWVLNALQTVPHVKARVAILPLGTGNDLSRALGWGPTCATQIDAHETIHTIQRAEEQPLDRWKITIKPRRSRLGTRRRDKILYAYNYASIGVDAQVALDFHYARTQFLYRYANRTLNYIAYAFLGAGRAFDDGGCQGLEKRLKVRLDLNNEPLELPPIQALVVLNIPSWGAGVDLWSMGDEDEVGEQSVNDGKLEVAGISSSFHIARLQCGLAEPYRFAQASRIVIDLNGSCAMQVDGEPWMQCAATVTIEHAGQSVMLRPKFNLEGTLY